MNLIREMLSYPFLVRALAGGMMVSLCASLLGVSLVLRRYSMIGDGLSHVSFGALSIALEMCIRDRVCTVSYIASAHPHPSPWSGMERMQEKFFFTYSNIV